VNVFRRYKERKRDANAMDFDDLLVNWKLLLEERAEIAEPLKRHFRFILADEYQDTNKLQADIIDLMASVRRNVMVVGDDAQAIYSFRGASFENILTFPLRFPGAAIYKLETNYRSTRQILTLANRSIEQAHIKDVIAYLKIMTNGRDELSWKRVLKLYPKIGEKTASEVWGRISQAADPLQRFLHAVEISGRGAAQSLESLRQVMRL